MEMNLERLAEIGSGGALPDEPPGWIWTVYPVRSADPMVAVGHSGNQPKARAAVEKVLLSPDANGAFGVVIGPDWTQDYCRRSADGGFAWRPLGGSDAD